MDNNFRISLTAEVPEGSERTINSNYVAYGKNNLYPQFLNSLVKECSVHQGVINQKTDFIFGGGFKTTLQAENVFIDAEESDEIIEGIIKDYEVLGYSIVLYKKHRGVWLIAESDSEKWRISEDGNRFFYSDDWTAGYQREGYNGYKVLNHYTAVDEDDDECVALISNPRKQSIDYFNPNSRKLNGNTYPSPIYSGAITSIMAYIEMAQYDYAESANGFVSNTLIQLNDGKPVGVDGETDQEAGIKVVKNLEKMFQDRTKRGGILFHFAESKETGMTVEELNRTQNVGKYNDTKKSISQNIMIAHSVQNSSLFGMEQEGGLGGTSAEEQLVAFAKFNKTYAFKRQNKISKEVNRSYKELNKVDLGGKFLPFKLDEIQKTEDVKDAPTEKPTLINEDDFMSEISKIGFAKPDNFNTSSLFSKSCMDNTSNDVMTSYFDSRKSVRFISDINLEILTLLKTGSKFKDLAEKFGAKEVFLILLSLRRLGLITKENKLTDKAIVEVGDEEDFKVVYSYEEIPGIPSLVKGGTHRPLCQFILAQNKLYSREEIDQLGVKLGASNLWMYRGGWYHNPNTHLNVHHCRHEWRQHIVKK